MNISNYWDHYAAKSQEFKIAVINEVHQHPIIAIAMLIFPIVGLAVVCVWGIRKVLLAINAKEVQKVNQYGLKTLKMPSSQTEDHPKVQLPENQWPITAARIGVFVLGTIGFLAMFRYVVSSGKISAPIPSITSSDVLPIAESCKSLVPYYVFRHIIPSPPAFSIPMVCPVIEKIKCLNESFTDLTCNALTYPTRIINPHSVIEPVSKNSIDPRILQIALNGAIFTCAILLDLCFPPIARGTPQNKKRKHHHLKNHHALIKNDKNKSIEFPLLKTPSFSIKQPLVSPQNTKDKLVGIPFLKRQPSSVELQLVTTGKKEIKLEEIPLSERQFFYFSLGLNPFEENALDSLEISSVKDEIEEDEYWDMMAWVGIGTAKFNLIKNFNNLTPQGVEKLKYTASFVDITKQFKKLSVMLHPDHGGKEETYQKLVEDWKSNFVETITIIYDTIKQTEEEVIFSINTEHLIELDEKMNCLQNSFDPLYEPYKLKRLIQNACTELKSVFCPKIPEESSSDHEVDIQECVSLNFLKSSLILELNTLTPEGIDQLPTNASFQEIGNHYLQIQTLLFNDEKLSQELENCWKTEFTEALKEIYEPESSDDDQKITIDIDELIELDNVLSKSQEKVLNLRTYDEG